MRDRICRYAVALAFVVVTGSGFAILTAAALTPSAPVAPISTALTVPSAF